MKFLKQSIINQREPAIIKYTGIIFEKLISRIY